MRVALFSNDMLQSYGRYGIICLTDINLLDRCDAIAECFVHLIFFLSVVVFIVLCMRLLFSLFAQRGKFHSVKNGATSAIASEG